MEEFDITTDVVVIGAGGSGLPAALSAKEAGARDVTIVERRKLTGGTVPLSGICLLSKVVP